MAYSRPDTSLDLLQNELAEDFRKAVVVLALLLATSAGILVRDRIPVRWGQVLAMQYIDYVILFNSIVTWLLNFLCGVMAGYNFVGIQCSFAAYFCLLVIGVSKLTVLMLMTETLHYIHSQTHQVSKRQDKQYISHIITVVIGTGICIIWVFIDFHGETRKEVCHITWHRDSFLYSLTFLLLMNGYLTFRCCFTLLRTRHAVMRAWAYRYISGFVICSITSLLNLGFMAICRGRMAIFICLTACLLDGNITVAAMHFLLNPRPTYKSMDDFSSINAVNMSPEMEEEVQARCPSILSKGGAPTYRTRQTTVLGNNLRGSSMRSFDTKSRVSCTLVSGATGQGIAAYLSQIDQESFAASEMAKDTVTVPRHVSLLPSHPAYEKRKWPKPMYSHFPNYSIESLNDIDEDDVSTAGDSFHENHPAWSERLPPQRRGSSSSARARAMLYACDDGQDSHDRRDDDDEEEGAQSSESRDAENMISRSASLGTTSSEATVVRTKTITFEK